MKKVCLINLLFVVINFVSNFMSSLRNFSIETFKKEKEYLMKCKKALDDFKFDSKKTNKQNVDAWYRLLILCLDYYRLLSSGHFCRPSLYSRARDNGFVYDYESDLATNNSKKPSSLFRYQGKITNSHDTELLCYYK
jgi:hypothetical protein